MIEMWEALDLKAFLMVFLWFDQLKLKQHHWQKPKFRLGYFAQ